MGNCFSDDPPGGTQAVGPTGIFSADPAAAAAAQAVHQFLRAKAYAASLIELSLSASNLRDRDFLSKSDPLAIIYTKKRDGTLEEIGRTEVVLNSLNPSWISKVHVDFHFETIQPLLFQIYDVDMQFHNVPEKMIKLEEQQFLGEAECLLSEVVGKRNRLLTLNLSNRGQNGNFGTLSIHAEETFSSKAIVEVEFHCEDLENKDLFSKSDPFLLVSRASESGARIFFCKTEVVNDNLNPIWKPVIINLQQVGSKENPLTIECFDFNSNGKHELIGMVVKSLVELEHICRNRIAENLYIPSNNGHAHQRKVLKSKFYVDKYIETQRQTFLDYISSGCELSFMVAIDFTASNGNPRLPDSLHYIDPSGRPNAYQRAILEIGEVLQFYDTDKRFPAWGFGGRPIDGPVSHCFNLNGSTHQSEVEGIQGIMSSYVSALYNVSLAGPTIFGPVISTASRIASNSLLGMGQKYFVLLIVTDGVVTDLQESIDAIVMASDLPLSILIVGVGGADFKDMEALDADKVRLQSSSGRIATRDIVQFVPMREVQGNEVSVVRSLLAELPEQFMTYMRSRTIQPLS